MTRTGMTAALITLFAGLIPATATAQEAEAPAKPPVVSHDLEGRSACLACHSGAMEAIPGVPESHTNRTDDTCLWCHGSDSLGQTVQPKAIPHDLEGRDACSMCHAAGAMEAIPDIPASHEGVGDGLCTLCHQKAG
jgi:hypothetical protein